MQAIHCEAQMKTLTINHHHTCSDLLLQLCVFYAHFSLWLLRRRQRILWLTLWRPKRTSGPSESKAPPELCSADASTMALTTSGCSSSLRSTCGKAFRSKSWLWHWHWHLANQKRSTRTWPRKRLFECSISMAIHQFHHQNYIVSTKP